MTDIPTDPRADDELDSNLANEEQIDSLTASEPAVDPGAEQTTDDDIRSGDIADRLDAQAVLGNPNLSSPDEDQPGDPHAAPLAERGEQS